jgi:hypothetical protein
LPQHSQQHERLSDAGAREDEDKEANGLHWRAGAVCGHRGEGDEVELRRAGGRPGVRPRLDAAVTAGTGHLAARVGLDDVFRAHRSLRIAQSRAAGLQLERLLDEAFNEG